MNDSGSYEAAFRRALKAWRDILGDSNVVLDDALLARRSTATFATNQRVAAIIRPKDRSQVQQCLRTASEHRIPIYPVSSGKNWGYGSSVPAVTGCVIMDLSRMNKILDFDEKLAYVTLQPGVTQGQLFAFLRQQGSRLWMDATGSSDSCSIVGNTLERGFGHTPYGDHFSHVCALEVVLATGECLRTGFARYDNAKAASVYRWGVGPSIDSLFSQSNLGVVTQMTVWLMPAPDYFQAFYFAVEKETSIGDVVDQLRPLRLDGTIASAVHIGNALKALSSLQRYPWQDANGTVPLPLELLGRLKKKWGLGAWNGAGGLYGTRAQVAAARARLKGVLRGRVQRLRFVDNTTLAVADKLHTPYKAITGVNLRELLNFVKPVYQLMQGVPTNSMLASTYWRKQCDVPAQPDPDRDGCGLLWCSSVVPATSGHVEEVRQIVQGVFQRWPYEPAVSITMITGRSLSHVLSISYDRSILGEDERALGCYRELRDNLASRGYYPYRLGIQDMTPARPGTTGYDRFLRTFREAFDPNHVLAPGRYE